MTKKEQKVACYNLAKKTFPNLIDECKEVKTSNFILNDGTVLGYLPIDAFDLPTRIKDRQPNKFILNEQGDEVRPFSCFYFVEMFKEKYNKFVKKVGKEKADKKGILIDVHFKNPYHNLYQIDENKKTRQQSLKTLPLQRSLLEALQKTENVDFVLLCLTCDTDQRNSKVVKVDLSNVKRSLRGQGITICDSFRMTYKPSLNVNFKFK